MLTAQNPLMVKVVNLTDYSGENQRRLFIGLIQLKVRISPINSLRRILVKC